MGVPDYPGALRISCQDARTDLQRVLAAACEPVPAWDPVMYLADFSRQVLYPLAAGVAEEEMAGTMAGRAFTTGQPVSAELDTSVRVSVRTGSRTSWSAKPPSDRPQERRCGAWCARWFCGDVVTRRVWCVTRSS